jgi:hypothetical protein
MSFSLPEGNLAGMATLQRIMLLHRSDEVSSILRYFLTLMLNRSRAL